MSHDNVGANSAVGAVSTETVPLHDLNTENLAEVVASDLESLGVSACAQVLDEAEIDRYRRMLDEAVKKDAMLLPPERRDSEFGRVVFLPHQDAGFLDLLVNETVIAPCNTLLGDDCTLYTMTSSCLPPGAEGRSLHVDTGIVHPGLLGVGVLVTLDDFNEVSGSTRFYPGTTDHLHAPSDFDSESVKLNCPAGSVCWFRGRQWHDVMPNRSDSWRRCIILAFIRPWIRQRFDMARLLNSEDLLGVDPRIGQKLGFNLLAPGSYDEYYSHPDERREKLLGRATA